MSESKESITHAVEERKTPPMEGTSNLRQSDPRRILRSFVKQFIAESNENLVSEDERKMLLGINDDEIVSMNSDDKISLSIDDDYQDNRKSSSLHNDTYYLSETTDDNLHLSIKGDGIDKDDNESVSTPTLSLNESLELSNHFDLNDFQLTQQLLNIQKNSLQSKLNKPIPQYTHQQYLREKQLHRIATPMKSPPKIHIGFNELTQAHINYHIESTSKMIQSQKDKIEMLTDENSRLKNILEERSVAFQNLEISDCLYKELQDRDESTLTNYELACLRATAMIYPLKKQLETTRRELEQQRIENRHSIITFETNSVESKRLAKLSEITIDNLKLELKASEQRCIQLKEYLELETKGRMENHDKAIRFDALNEQYKLLETQLSEVRKTLEQQSQTLAILYENEKQAKITIEDLSKSKDLLILDKNYLQNEIKNTLSLVDEKIRLAESHQSRAMQLEIKVAQLTDQLVNLQLVARSGFDERMEKEINRIREESLREMESMRMTSKEIADRENRVLREAKESLEAEIHQLHRRNDSLVNENNQLQRQLSNQISDKNQEISYLNADLKMKNFELTALGVTFEERMSQLRQLEIELSATKEELQIHKTAVVSMDAKHARDVETLSRDLESALSKLRSYEILEEEIDDAVIRKAQHLASGADESGRGDAALIHSLHSIPSNPNRRMKQALFLAQRLLQAEKQRDQYKEQLIDYENRFHSLQAEIEDLNRQLKLTTEPSNYIITKLRDEENRNFQLQSYLKDHETTLKQLIQEKDKLTYENKQLKERLKILLEQRKEIEQLQSMLMIWKEQQQQQEILQESDSETDDDDGDDEEKIIESTVELTSPHSHHDKTPMISPPMQTFIDEISPELKKKLLHRPSQSSTKRSPSWHKHIPSKPTP